MAAKSIPPILSEKTHYKVFPILNLLPSSYETCSVDLPPINLFNVMRYYHVASRIFIQECSLSVHTNSGGKADGFKLEPSPEGWMKINVDDFRKHWTKLASIRYVMRTVIPKGKRIENCHING